MDILALPDVFLRQLMRTVKIQDRLRLRLTCRTFEKLVAETSAGCVKHGCIDRYQRDNEDVDYEFHTDLVLGIDGAKLGPIRLERLDEFLLFSQRLFQRISMNEFEIDIDDEVPVLDFVIKLTEKFKIRRLLIPVCCETELKGAMQIFAVHPTSDFAMRVWFLPTPSLLLSLPPMKKLHISAMDVHLDSAELFFKLLDAHVDLRFDVDYVELTANEFMRALQILSAYTQHKKIHLRAKYSLIMKLLDDHGITEASDRGYRCGEFEIIGTMYKRICLQYRRCLIELSKLEWENQSGTVSVDISNCDTW